MTATQDITVTVTDVSEQPEVTGDSTIDFAENDSRDVATYTVTDPVADSEHDWTVEGADAAAFTITNTGALSFMSEPDYEMQPSYEITVKATDKSDPTRYGTRAVVVTITDENEAPAFTSSASFSLAENQTAVATVTATDQDSADSVTGYEPLSGADKDLFTIATDGALSFISVPDFETPQGGANDDTNTYELMVTATSGTGERALIATQNLTVTITDANDVPVVTGEATVDYAENDSSDVATFTVTDQDAGVMHTWSVEGTDDSAFSIGEESGVLSFKASPDFETQYLYEVTVIATDDGDPAQSGTYAVTITVTDENDAPMFTSSASFSVAENQTAVDTVAATDQDSADSVISYEPLTGADKDLFTIATDGALSFISAPDFETPQGGANDDTNTYELTVSATSGTGERALTATQDLTITVTDANDVPMFTSGSTFSLAENQTSVDTVTATDQDSADSVISYEPLTGADKDLFTITTDGALSFNSTPDFENPQGGANDDSNTYELTVTATSGTGTRAMTATQNLTVAVTNVNEAPKFTSSDSFSMAENETAVGTVSASDEDSADSVADYELGGADAGLFTITSNGALSFNSAPDFENPQGGANDDSNSYELTVTATSGTGTRAMTATQNLTVTVTNVNEPPIVDGETSIDYTENGEDAVETYTVTDPDAGSEHTWTVEGTDAASFTITNGALSFKSWPDYETKSSYSVTVKATDNGTPAKSGTKTVNITITDVPTSYRQVRIWTGRNLDNDDDVLLITVGAWSTNPNPNDAANITSTTETSDRNDEGQVQITITWTDNHGNYAYQRSQWHTPRSQHTQYRRVDTYDDEAVLRTKWSTDSNPPLTRRWPVDWGWDWQGDLQIGTRQVRGHRTFNGGIKRYGPWVDAPEDFNVINPSDSGASGPPDPVRTNSTIEPGPVTLVGETPVYTPNSGPTENLTHINRRERQ